jgi:LemA protein
VAIVCLLAVASTGCGYNRILGADEDVKAAWAEVQNQYQRRMDLIPNLVNVVKGAADFERETLEAVIEARAKATQVKIDAEVLDDPAAFARMQAAQGALGSALSRLLVTVERYPQLTATENFRTLQAQLEGTENRIAVARRRFVESVSSYNKLVRQFPTNLTARFLLGVEVRPTFTATEGAESAPQVEF